MYLMYKQNLQGGSSRGQCSTHEETIMYWHVCFLNVQMHVLQVLVACTNDTKKHGLPIAQAH